MYTLEVWDSVTGTWYVVDSTTKYEPRFGTTVIAYAEADNQPWRIIKTTITRKSANQPIGG